MEILRSNWVLGFLALALMLGVNAYVVIKKVEPMLLIFTPEEKVVPVAEQPGFWSFRSWEIEQLIIELEEKYKDLSKDEVELKELKAYLEAEKEEIEDSRRKLEVMREELSGEVVKIESKEKKNLSELADTYSNLPPEAIVEIFNQMDDEFVLKILSFMEPGVVAPIFQVMINSTANEEFSVNRVARLSELIRKKSTVN